MNPATRAAHLLRGEPRPADIDAVREIVASTGYFTLEEIDVAVELVEERLAQGPSSGYEFVFVDEGRDLDARPVAYACFGRVPLTQSSFDLYWIAVRDDRRGKGLGRVVLAEAERRIAAIGGERVYAETASRPQYEPTRAFYRACGYAEAAHLPDFYSSGDGKVIYAKRLER
ncbi:MAG: GNAT family N-acetyltransferase [Phycisphaerales bacterium]|nr:GNAT family N-acetyltransferase [Phycisphaerales bacterium]